MSQPSTIAFNFSAALEEFHQRTNNEFNAITDASKLALYAEARGWHWIARALRAGTPSTETATP